MLHRRKDYVQMFHHQLMKFCFQQLKQTNLQLQGRNQKLESKLQQLQELARRYDETIQRLNAEINPNSTESVHLTPKQQVFRLEKMFSNIFDKFWY